MSDLAAQPAPVPQVEAEPQNALTKKFSEKDWEGVKALRVRADMEISDPSVAPWNVIDDRN